ncbi:MAG: inosine/xanthosine triphosphatase [Microgenomates group bacterium Gr01-1014_16]|nr:MAG: inosine/xanthosine triphosphatase [Microgenomates group bacterium Gr01-1014_16]
MTNVIKIIVASTNPTKLTATQTGFEKMFPGKVLQVSGLKVESGVSNQPMTSRETRRGARTKATNAKTAEPNADYWVGLEGGVERDDPEFVSHPESLRSVVWCAILATSSDKYGEGQPGTYSIPDEIGKLILENGIELGIADDLVFKRQNSKQGEGSVGILTHGTLNRGLYYSQAVILALVRFVNPNLFP